MGMWKALSIFPLAASSFGQPPAFEAATIKPSKPEIGHSGSHSRPGRLVMDGQTLKSLICIAYNVKDFQVSGGPKWITEDRYDINAKAEGAANGDQLRQMLQTLLADGFQLVFHHEQKILPSFAMVPLKSGLKVQPVEGTDGSHSSGSRGTLTVTGMSMAKFADSLTRQLGAPVTDQTGSPGAYNFKLEWSTDGDKDDLQSAFLSALQTQLGVKLESRKLPVDTLVVDRAEKPSEN